MRKNSLHIAMIIQDYLPFGGGAERQLASLIPHLKSKGGRISVVTRKQKDLPMYEIVDGVTVCRIPLFGSKTIRSLGFIFASTLVLSHWKADILHAHGLLSPATAAVWAKKRTKAPVIAKVLRGGCFGDLDRISSKPFGSVRQKWLLSQIDRFLVISQEIDSELERIGIPIERRIRLPNGVDTDRFAPISEQEKIALRAELGLPDVPIAVFLGRLSPEKHVDMLIRVWKSLSTTLPDSVLLILGTGEQEEDLKKIADDRVKFVGQTTNVVPYLQASDLFMLPSETEGLSNAMLEAMAVGLPVVVTAVGGAPDVINHKVDGWLIKPMCPEEMSDALQALLLDQGLRQQLGIAARKKMVEKFALPMVAEKLWNNYLELVRGEG